MRGLKRALGKNEVDFCFTPAVLLLCCVIVSGIVPKEEIMSASYFAHVRICSNLYVLLPVSLSPRETLLLNRFASV